MKTTSERGAALDYLAVVPDDYDAAQVYPLIVCLHGFGASKEDLSPLAPLIDGQRYVYVLPDAPLAVAGEPQVRAWYERGGKESPQAVAEALAALDGFVAEVTARFRPPRALLLGFSQGGAMSLRYGLPRPELFAGIAVLSGSLKRVQDVRASLPATRTQAIFVAHGRHDALVPYEWSRDLVAFLEEAGYRPTYRSYSIDHEISPKEVADLRDWIGQALA